MNVFLILILPILLILMVGFTYNSTNYSNTNVGIVNINQSFFDYTNDDIKFIQFSDVEQCIKKIENRAVVLCAWNNETQKKNEIIFYIDNSNSVSSNVFDVFKANIKDKTVSSLKDEMNNLETKIDSTLNTVETKNKMFLLIILKSYLN